MAVIQLMLARQAREVFESFNRKFEWVEDGVPAPQFSAIAAALRTAVGHATAENASCPEHCSDSADRNVASYLLAVADELEANANDQA